MRKLRLQFLCLTATVCLALPAYGSTDFEVGLFAVDSDDKALEGSQAVNFCISETCSGSDRGTCLIEEDETATFEGGVYETTVALSSLAASPPNTLCLWVTIGGELLSPLSLGSVIWARWAEVAGSVVSGGITASALATDAVTTTKILDSTIATADLADSAITTAKIADATIIAGDIATDAVTTTKILDGTIAAGDMATGAVTTTVILDETIAAGDIASSAVTTAKVATDAVDGTKISLTGEASGNLTYFDGTNWVRLANGTAGQLLQTGTPPSWVTSSGVPTLTTFRNWGSGVSANATSNSLTVRNVGLFVLPGSITVNQLTYELQTITTAGTAKICIYTADGATKKIDVTSDTQTTVTSVATAGTILDAGNYYVAYGCATTCNVTPWTVAATISTIGANTPAGKLAYTGTVTHTSGTCNATLGTVTASNGATTLAIRLDN